MRVHDQVILALETSQRTGSVALAVPGRESRAISFPCGSRQDDLLMPSIATLFEQEGTQQDAIDVIAVSVGPGGFTGLRIGVSTAKGIAEVTGCSLLAVPSALATAESIRDRLSVGDRVIVASAAKADSCWLTSLVMESDGWRQESAGLHHVEPPSPEVIALCKEATVIADEFMPEMLRSALTGVEEPILDAMSVMQVALGKLERGETTDPLDLAPIYPREPDAVTLWNERRSGRVE